MSRNEPSDVSTELHAQWVWCGLVGRCKSRRRRSRSWSLRKGHGDDWVIFSVVITNMIQPNWFANHVNNENGRMAAPVITRPLMTVAQSSRTTLADLIPLIEQANLSPIQKRDQISAVKTTARLLGATPAEIDADPIRLRKRLETIAPRRWGSLEAAGTIFGRWLARPLRWPARFCLDAKRLGCCPSGKRFSLHSPGIVPPAWWPWRDILVCGTFDPMR